MSKIADRGRIKKAGSKKYELFLTKKYIEEAFEDECVLVVVSMRKVFTTTYPAIQAFANGTTTAEIKRYINNWQRNDNQVDVVEIKYIMDTTGKTPGDLVELLSATVNSSFTDFLGPYLETATDNNEKREAHASELAFKKLKGLQNEFTIFNIEKCYKGKHLKLLFAVKGIGPSAIQYVMDCFTEIIKAPVLMEHLTTLDDTHSREESLKNSSCPKKFKWVVMLYDVTGEQRKVAVTAEFKTVAMTFEGLFDQLGGKRHV